MMMRLSTGRYFRTASKPDLFLKAKAPRLNLKDLIPANNMDSVATRPKLFGKFAVRSTHALLKTCRNVPVRRRDEMGEMCNGVTAWTSTGMCLWRDGDFKAPNEHRFKNKVS